MQTLQMQHQNEEFLDELYDVVADYRPTLFWHKQEASPKQKQYIRKSLAQFDKTEIRKIFEGVKLTKGLASEIIDSIHIGLPPTEGQIFLLERLGVESSEIVMLTKSEATELIEELLDFDGAV